MWLNVLWGAGALVIAVSHYGKSAETGVRGSSAFTASADSILAVHAERDAIPRERDEAVRRRGRGRRAHGPYGPGSAAGGLIRLALALRQPVSEVFSWDDRTIATAVEWLDERNDAAKDAAKGRR